MVACQIQVVNIKTDCKKIDNSLVLKTTEKRIYVSKYHNAKIT